MTGLSGGAAVAAAVRANAASAEVSVGSVKVAGPTNAVEIVATPATNERAFLDQAGVHVGALLRGVATPDRAYLVRIVSASGAPLLVLGANPALGGGGAGSGIAWQAPGLRSGAVWGNPVPTT